MNENEWAKCEFEKINFGDSRLNERLVNMAGQFLLNSESNIPSACDGWHDTKAAYRFFKNKKVNYEKITHAHRAKSIDRIGDDEIVLLIQDTTFINYVNHNKTTGLGRIGKNKYSDSKGLTMHSALALSERGVPIGILDEKIYSRPFLDGLKYSDRHKTPIEEKESYRWLESLRNSIKDLKNPHRFVTIADREADIYEFMLEAKKLDTNFLIRALRDRAINKKSKRSPVDEKIWDHMKKKKPVGVVTTKIQSKSNGNKSRDVTLEIRVSNFILQPPQQLRDYVLNDPKPIKTYAIYVTEKGNRQAKKEDRIEWMLLTNIATWELEDALTRIQWYKFRWRIELLHKIMKSGYRIEACRLSTSGRLKNYIALISIIAFRVLFMTYFQKEDFDVGAEEAFSNEEMEVLKMKSRKVGDDFTLNEATRVIARLGGFFGRESDGDPGFMTIWRGLRKLNDLVEGYKLGKTSFEN